MATASESTRRPTGNGHYADAASDILRDSTRQVSDELKKAGEFAREVADEQIDKIKDFGSENLERLTKFVKDRPVTALLISAGFGYLAASMCRRS